MKLPAAFRSFRHRNFQLFAGGQLISLMAVYSMMFMGMAPVGALLAGLVAGRLGAPLAVALGGAVCTAAAALFALRLPRLRPDARRLIVAQQVAGGDPPQEGAGGGIPLD